MHVSAMGRGLAVVPVAMLGSIATTQCQGELNGSHERDGGEQHTEFVSLRCLEVNFEYLMHGECPQSKRVDFERRSDAAVVQDPPTLFRFGLDCAL
jgi:hypothetical protein